MKKLSLAAQSLWAKKSKNNELLWLPLVMHLADSAGLAQRLWHRWLPSGVRRVIEAGLYTGGSAEQLLVFLAAAHDIGKATPVFQAKNVAFIPCDLDEMLAEKLVAAGLPMWPYSAFQHPSKSPHALATQVLLQNDGCDPNVAVILGAHHGKPPEASMLSQGGIGSQSENYYLEKRSRQSWTDAQRELVAFALDLAGFKTLEALPKPNMASQALLCGLLIMTDWIASSEQLFPYIRPEDVPELESLNARVNTAWERLQLPVPWSPDNTWMYSDLYSERFDVFLQGYAPNAVQSAVEEVAADIDEPGILVIEAPMGSGKTEAALVAAEIFAAKEERSGVFFALPTQATSDGMFPRLLEWIGSLQDDGKHSINLAHGKAQFNDNYQALQPFAVSSNITADEESSAFVHQWFEGRKRSLLADFVVGTIDQLLLAALKQKHVMLRHLGLANKVVVIDECHAFDAYMSRYLERALRWLGAYRVPVIVLSATLPAEKRQMVIDAYRGKSSTPEPVVDLFGHVIPAKELVPAWTTNRAYPLITYTEGGDVKQKEVRGDSRSTKVVLVPLAEDALLEKLGDLLSGGGCAGVLVNTVKRAQELARLLRERFGQETVRLLHSRFLAPDRIRKEQDLRKELGKPGNDVQRPAERIVVGTQVLEQSLDIDFDVLVTDFCPMDLLLQRIGRLHRHRRTRPAKLRSALCLILGLGGDVFESGAAAIYGDYLLMRSRAFLPQHVVLPQGIPVLVQNTYDDDIAICPEPLGYQEARAEWKRLIACKEGRADKFRICPPWSEPGVNMVGWLDTDVSDKQGEASVRDSDESFAVLMVREVEGAIRFLPWIEGGREIARYETPNGQLAHILAKQSIQLPGALCSPWVIDRTIKELEQMNREQLPKWQESVTLKGELFLVLDESCSVSLAGYRLRYDQDDGLVYEKEVLEDVRTGV